MKDFGKPLSEEQILAARHAVLSNLFISVCLGIWGLLGLYVGITIAPFINP